MMVFYSYLNLERFDSTGGRGTSRAPFILNQDDNDWATEVYEEVSWNVSDSVVSSNEE